MPSCLPRDDRRVCGNTAVIAGDPEKRETEPLRRSVLASCQDTSGLLCRQGKFFHSQAGLFTQAVSKLYLGWPYSNWNTLISFPTTRNNQVLFPSWKERWADSLCACHKVHANCEGQVALFLSFVQQWWHSGTFQWAMYTLAEDHAHKSRLYSIFHHRISKFWLNLTTCPGFGWELIFLLVVGTVRYQ